MKVSIQTSDSSSSHLQRGRGLGGMFSSASRVHCQQVGWGRGIREAEEERKEEEEEEEEREAEVLSFPPRSQDSQPINSRL